MMRFLRNVILNNLALKLLALAISFALWVIYAGQPLAQFAYDVPIAFVNVPRELAISSDPPAVAHLLVQGRATLIRRLAPADMAISVDLSRAQPGETSVRLTSGMAAVPYGASILRIEPAQFDISLVAPSKPPPQDTK
jgi:hypothetical protein